MTVDKPSLTLRAGQQRRSVGSCSLPVTCVLDKRHNSSGSNMLFPFYIFQKESQSNNERSRPEVHKGLLGILSLPVSFARYWTVEVFPVPVSPTRRTGSPRLTQTASCSSRTAEGRVAANVWLSLSTVIKTVNKHHIASILRTCDNTKLKEWHFLEDFFSVHVLAFNNNDCE